MGNLQCTVQNSVRSSPVQQPVTLARGRKANGGYRYIISLGHSQGGALVSVFLRAVKGDLIHSKKQGRRHCVKMRVAVNHESLNTVHNITKRGKAVVEKELHGLKHPEALVAPYRVPAVSLLSAQTGR